MHPVCTLLRTGLEPICLARFFFVFAASEFSLVDDKDFAEIMRVLLHHCTSSVVLAHCSAFHPTRVASLGMTSLRDAPSKPAIATQPLSLAVH